MATATSSLPSVSSVPPKDAQPRHEPASATTALPTTSSAPTIPIKVEFTGGLEILFQNRRQHTIHLPQHPQPTQSRPDPPTIHHLIHHLTRSFLAGMPKPRRELFSVAEDEITEDQTSTLRSDAAPADGGVREDGVGEGGRLTVRPGILVLVNDADWELEGATECALAEGDEVVFVSTLHGG